MRFYYRLRPCFRWSLLTSLLLALLPLLAVAGQLRAQVSESRVQNQDNYLVLTAPAGAVFTSVDYASYGTPTANGDGTYTTSSCHESNSQAVVESYALNKNTFSIPVNSYTFADATHNGDPCFGTVKSLAVVVTYSFSPLPVVLTGFTVATTKAAVSLTWTTASELNSAYFDVQRSTTGSAFVTIGTVAAQGNRATQTSYTFQDVRLPASSSLLYYRLRQVDNDASSTYSPVRSVRLNASAEPELTLYPNPVQAVTTLLGARAYAPVQVLTLVGGVVLATTADANGTAALTLPTSLLPGLYIVRTGARAVRLLVK